MTTQRRYDIHSDPENIVCAKFGCGKHLSLIEQLAGKYCTAHRGHEYGKYGNIHREFIPVIEKEKPHLKEAIEKLIVSKIK